jgi:hypothetical protein
MPKPPLGGFLFGADRLDLGFSINRIEEVDHIRNSQIHFIFYPPAYTGPGTFSPCGFCISYATIAAFPNALSINDEEIIWAP